MSWDRVKRASEWFYSMIFQDEEIQPKAAPQAEKLPSALRAARSLQVAGWQNREAIFLKQGKLLADYEDDYEFSDPVTRYYPTYQSLNDRELRGYFSWRTALRKGIYLQAPTTFAYLYIYELLNQIGVASPEDGYEKLVVFRDEYCPLDPSLLPYLTDWMQDYVICYDLSPSLPANPRQADFDRNILILRELADRDNREIMEAVRFFAPKWLERSRFYSSHGEDMDRVLCRVLRQMSAHYAKRCIRGFTEQYFGGFEARPVTLFQGAVFCGKAAPGQRSYTVNPVRTYRCQNGLWSVECYPNSQVPNQKLNNLIRTVDSVMRELYDFRPPIQPKLDVKWQLKLIRQEAEADLAEQKAAAARKVTIDLSRLSAIRHDADLTRDKLIVDEELPEPIRTPEPPAPTPEPAPDSPLTPPQYRLMQCLLYGGSLDWVHTEGLLLSVLVDGINEALFDLFDDTVLTADEPPEIIEDYLEELKGMILP